MTTEHIAHIPNDGAVRELRAQQTVRLDDRETFLFTRSGALDVFIVDPNGRRRHVATVHAGDVIFPIVAPQVTTVAVALTDARVFEAPVAAFDTNGGVAFAQWADRIHAERVPDLSAGLPRALEQLHQDFLERLREADERETARRRHVAETRERLTRETTHRVLAELASTAGATVTAVPPESPPLLAAVIAVTQAQGIQAVVPPSLQLSGDFDRDLDSIRRASRIRTRTVLLTGMWWKEDVGPLLARDANDGRPLAVLPRGASKYELFDPLDQTYVALTAGVARRLTPAAVMFYRPLPDTITGPIDFIRFTLQGRRRDLVTAGVAALAVTLLGMVAPIAMAVLVNHAIPDASRALLFQIALVLLAAAAARALFETAQNIAMLRIESRSSVVAQAALWDRLLNLRLSEVRQYSAGDLQARINAVESMRQKLGSGTMRTLLASSLALLNLVLMFIYSTSLAAMATVIALVVAAVTIVSGRSTLRNLRPLLRLRGEIFGFVVQLVQGVSKLRVAGAEERAFARWGAQFRVQQATTRDVRATHDRVEVFNQIVPALAAALLFTVAGRAVLAGNASTLTLGVFLAFNIAFGTFIAAIATMSSTVIEALDAVQLWSRARPILQAEVEADPQKITPAPLRGDMALDHVTFRYRDDGPLTLEDVSLHARAGEFVAIVGPSGSGKSTIFRVLLGFETPQSGAIYFDGQDLAGLAAQEVRRQVGVVLQSSRILAASIFENIAAAAGSVTLTEAWEAARRAGFAEEIESFPMQMHTHVSEGGTNLSGGQRQRLLIARALARKPPILLLDEATSALDNQTQAKVSQSLERLGVTRIVIAHRLSTIEKADRIYVLDAGHIVQQGTFDELVAQSGLFARLVARQRLTH